MDWRCIEIGREKAKVLIDSYLPRSVEKLSCLIKTDFSRRRKTHKWMQSSKLFNQRSKQHFKLSKTSLNKKNVKHLDPKHTHTHTLIISNQFYISKMSQNSLVSIHYHMYSLWWPNHIVPAYVSKVAKNFACYVWKTSQDCINVYMLWRFEIWENQFNTHIIITAWWGLSLSR